MRSSLDRYYTPRDVAIKILEDSRFDTVPTSCADSACGSGRLLAASEAVFGGQVSCIGIDKDRSAIARLRRARPDWELHVGDLLLSRKFKVERGPVDLLVLNPPFSSRRSKSVEFVFNGMAVRASVAMAHLFASIRIFQPALGAVAIVPESLLHSELDSAARKLLLENFSMSEILELHATTFEGARANAVAVQILKGKQDRIGVPSTRPAEVVEVRLERGGVPMFQVKRKSGGTPLLHTTMIEELLESGDAKLPRVQASNRGRVSGWNVFLPRVGTPRKHQVAEKWVRQIQLSDCVIAVKCKDKRDAQIVSARLRENWAGLLQQYKGTGARYTTMSKLTSFSQSIGLACVRVFRRVKRVER